MFSLGDEFFLKNTLKVVRIFLPHIKIRITQINFLDLNIKMSQENQMKIAAITEKNIEYLNSENIKMKPENQMETPLITEKEIEH